MFSNEVFSLAVFLSAWTLKKFLALFTIQKPEVFRYFWGLYEESTVMK